MKKLYIKKNGSLSYVCGPASLRVGAGNSTTNDVAGNGKVYLKSVDDDGVISNVLITGSDGVTVTSGANGAITITGGGSASSNVVATPTITGDTSAIIGDTLNVGFSASALLSGAVIASFTYSLDGGELVTVTATNNAATASIPIGSGYSDGDQISLVVTAKDNYENTSQSATQTIDLVYAHVTRPSVTLGNTSIYPNAAVSLTGSTFACSGTTDTLNNVEFAAFMSNSTTATKAWSSTNHTDTTKSIPADTLAAGTYYIGMRYKGSRLGWSDWSDLKSLTVKAAYVNTPTITLGQTSIYPNAAVTLTASALSVTGGTANLSDIEFALFSSNSTSGSPVWESTGHTNTSVTVPANTLTAGTYYAAVREKDASLGWSPWSAIKTLTVNAAYVNAPTISSPSANAEILKSNGMTVTLNSMSVTGGTDTQASIQVDICSNSAGTTVSKTKTVNGTGNSVTFSQSDLSSLTNDTTYYLCAYRTGTKFGKSEKSSRVAVKFKNISTTLNDNAWETIKSIGAAGTGDTYWDVGDTKDVALSGTVGTLSLSGTYKVTIIDFNYKDSNGIYFQGFKNSDGVDVALCCSEYGTSPSDGSKVFNMNHWGNNNYGGWKGCDMRYDILGSTDKAPSGYGAAATTSRVGYDATSAAKTSPVANTLMAALPSDLRANLAAWTVYTDNTGNASNASENVTSSVDYLPLLAEYEIFGARSGANQYEQNYQSQMKYYANGNSKVRYNHSNPTAAVYWWERSPFCDIATYFRYVSTDGSSYYTSAYGARGVAPAFKVS
ncbi:MAG: hypothetical protein IJU76_14215 [Desulfovibrionaceae bacterium]|nr:hypothetical protein [Desulfovibrionaceae bacterium]